MKNDLLLSALQQKILPAVTFSSADEALPLAEAMLKGGFRVMEVTLRTPAAMEAISLISKKFPDMLIGAGTILSATQLQQAIDAGARFGLAPGFNPGICKNAIDKNFPFIPGVMTPSEIEQAAGLGFNILKLFPASIIQGVHFLQALAEPYQSLQLKFIPMGGVSVQNMNEYLQMDNVIAVGGSWLSNRKYMESGQFNKITDLVKEALAKVQ